MNTATDLHAQLEQRLAEWQTERDARIRAEQATIAACELNEQLREELRRGASRLEHIHITLPEDAVDARRAVGQFTAYLRTLAGLSAVAVSQRAARADLGPVTEIPVAVADVAVVVGFLEGLGAAGGDDFLAGALERLGRAVRIAEGEEPAPFSEPSGQDAAGEAR